MVGRHLLLIMSVIFVIGCSATIRPVDITYEENSIEKPYLDEGNNPEEMTVTIGMQVFTALPGEHTEITVNEAQGAEPEFKNSGDSMPWSSVASIYYNGEIYWEDVLGAVQFFIPDRSGKYDYRISVIQEEGDEEKIYTFTINYQIEKKSGTAALFS